MNRVIIIEKLNTIRRRKRQEENDNRCKEVVRRPSGVAFLTSRSMSSLEHTARVRLECDTALMTIGRWRFSQVMMLRCWMWKFSEMTEDVANPSEVWSGSLGFCRSRGLGYDKSVDRGMRRKEREEWMRKGRDDVLSPRWVWGFPEVREMGYDKGGGREMRRKRRKKVNCWSYEGQA